MSADQLAALVAKVSADPALAQRFDALSTVDEAVALAAEFGYEVTADELSGVIAQASQEMSDDELATASGGTYNPYLQTLGCTSQCTQRYC